MKNPIVIWFFGLSGSGKSTLANLLLNQLNDSGISAVSIDGDQLRAGINQDLGFSSEDRMENVRRSAEIAKLLLENHEVVIASFITPEEQHREKVREILGTSVRFIFVDADVSICRERDVKGLYKKVENGTMAQFTGVSAPFERPTQVDLILDTNEQTTDECLDQILHTFFDKG
ncbi:MAG: adenylyl-sulfate kinase [Flavobacteriia bacterium]